MLYTSTRDKSIKVSAAQAIAQGISEEGGLFVPCELPKFSIDKISSMTSMSYIERAKTVLKEFLTDFTAEELDYCVSGAYAAENFLRRQLPPPLILTAIKISLSCGTAPHARLKIWRFSFCLI